MPIPLLSKCLIWANKILLLCCFYHCWNDVKKTEGLKQKNAHTRSLEKVLQISTEFPSSSIFIFFYLKMKCTKYSEILYIFKWIKTALSKCSEKIIFKSQKNSLSKWVIKLTSLKLRSCIDKLCHAEIICRQIFYLKSLKHLDLSKNSQLGQWGSSGWFIFEVEGPSSGKTLG